MMDFCSGAADISNVDQCKQSLVRGLNPSGLRMVLFPLAGVLTDPESCGSRNLLSVHRMPITIIGT